MNFGTTDDGKVINDNVASSTVVYIHIEIFLPNRSLLGLRRSCRTVVPNTGKQYNTF